MFRLYELLSPNQFDGTLVKTDGEIALELPYSNGDAVEGARIYLNIPWEGEYRCPMPNAQFAGARNSISKTPMTNMISTNSNVVDSRGRP